MDRVRFTVVKEELEVNYCLTHCFSPECRERKGFFIWRVSGSAWRHRKYRLSSWASEVHWSPDTPGQDVAARHWTPPLLKRKMRYDQLTYDKMSDTNPDVSQLCIISYVVCQEFWLSQQFCQHLQQKVIRMVQTKTSRLVLTMKYLRRGDKWVIKNLAL